MKATILIITEDQIFPKYFLSTHYRQLSEIEAIICKSMSDIKSLFTNSNCKLVIIDGTITRMVCSEVIQQIKNLRTTSCPIWLIPAINNEEYFHESYELGVSRIFTKPFDPFIITQKIKYLIQG